jgi:hypothetical protein
MSTYDDTLTRGRSRGSLFIPSALLQISPDLPRFLIGYSQIMYNFPLTKCLSSLQPNTTYVSRSPSAAISITGSVPKCDLH